MVRFELSPWQRLQYEIATIKNVRTPYHPQWMEIADVLLPYRLRLNLSDNNRGSRLNTRMYDSTATFAVETLESGLIWAGTDPASRWFNLTTKDKARAEFGPNKRWLDYATDKLLAIMGNSNLYQSLAMLYGNCAGFGTSLMSIEEVIGPKVFFTRMPAMGSWWIAQDMWNEVTEVYTEFRMTLRQMYQRFGEDADYSVHAVQLMQRGRWQEWIDIGHMVMPNEEYDPRSEGRGREKAYSSRWFELGSTGAQQGYMDNLVEGHYLADLGFDDFPYLCARWEMTEGDTYAIDCPGMKSIGDTKGLQVYEKTLARGIVKVIDPHWLANEGLTEVDPGFIPGGISYVQERDGNPALRPAHILDPGFIAPATEKEKEIRDRIYTAFHTKTFQTLRFMEDRSGRTATEIMERKAEGLNDIAKTFTSIQNSVLTPTIKRTLKLAIRQGWIEPPPQDVQDLDYEYNGVLAQSQRLSKVQPVDRILATAGQIAAAGQNPAVWDKINVDQAMDVLATNLGVDATVIRSDEEVDAIRSARAKQQQAQALMQQMPALAKGAKDLSETNLNSDNALAALTNVRR